MKLESKDISYSIWMIQDLNQSNDIDLVEWIVYILNNCRKEKIAVVKLLLNHLMDNFESTSS